MRQDMKMTDQNQHMCFWFVVKFIIIVIGIGHSASEETSVSDCAGINCMNYGSLRIKDGHCYCRCNASYSGVFCEYELQKSVWPQGPYALHMSKDGCPESIAHGWTAGYINVTTKSPLYINIISTDYFNQYDENIAEEWNLLGPFGNFSIQFNFCYKMADHPFSDEGEWPRGEYLVYGTDQGCPGGFEQLSRSALFPPVLHWNEDGHLPKLKTKTLDNGTFLLEFSLCRRKDQSLNKNVSERQNATLFELQNTAFMLLQDEEEEECPNSVSMNVTHETLVVHSNPLPGNNDSTQETNKDCSNIHIKRIFMEGSYNELVKSRSTSNLEFVLEWFAKRVPPWVVYDLGRAMTVTGMTFYNYNVDSARKYQHVYADNNLIAISIGNDIWEFLNHGALLCRFYFQRFIHVCKRPQKGRYVSLATTSWARTTANHTTYLFFDAVSSVNILTCSIASEKVCNKDMGMADAGIEDFQISASSWKLEFPPYLARPFNSGWCAEGRGKNHFIQIDLLSNTLIEGVIVENWIKIVNTLHNNTYQQNVQAVGCRSFSVSYGSTNGRWTSYGTKVFQLDLSRPFSHQQLFLFRRPFLARYVRLHPVMSFSPDENCMKFELIGCRKTGIHSLTCENDITRTVVTSKRPFRALDEAFIQFEASNPLVLLPKEETYGQICNESLDCDECKNSWNQTEGELCYSHTNSDLTTPPYVPSDTLSAYEYCKQACIRVSICSVALIRYEVMCSMYGVSKFHSYQLSDNDLGESQSAFTSICWGNASDVGPLLYNPIRTNSGLYIPQFPQSATITLTEESIITSPGYPYHYDTSLVFRWNIQFNQGNYIRFLFSNISLHEYETKHVDHITCAADFIIISTSDHIHGLIHSDNFYLIDNQFNGRTTTIATSFSRLLLTFQPCMRHSQRTYTGNGFRVIIRKDDEPSCFKLRDGVQDEYCSEKTMRLASSSFLDIPIAQGEEERWILICTEHIGVIKLTFLEFDVQCYSGSTFTITDDDGWGGTSTSYCNANRPVKDIYSTLERLYIRFYHKVSEYGLPPERFAAVYTTIWQNKTIADMVSYEKVVTVKSIPDETSWKWNYLNMNDDYLKVCSDDLQKCYFLYPTRKTWNDASRFCVSLRRRLASVNSRQEMQFINLAFEKLLIFSFDKHVQRWVLSNWFGYIPSVRLYIYIGLSRFTGSDGFTYEVWEDGSPLIFSAWDKDQPSDVRVKKCTRMHAGYLNKKNTWETVNCNEHVADYSVCEEQSSKRTVSGGVLHKENEITEHFLNETLLEPSLLFQCTSGEWLIFMAVCNGIPECGDSSDEQQGCNVDSYRTHECPDDMFRCNNGRCLDTSEVCDLKNDCENGEDEYCDISLCTRNEFQCKNGQCIADYERCDAVFDCLEGSDEIDCAQCNTTTAFQCVGDLTCIPVARRCDGYPDCTDSRDEDSCNLPSYTFCEQWLEAGHSETGIYVIDGDQAECNFDMVDSANLIKVVFPNIDVTWGMRKSGLEGILNKPGGRTIDAHSSQCKLLVKQECVTSVIELTEYEGTQSNCLCTILSATIVRNSLYYNQTIKNCNQEDESPASDMAAVGRDYTNRDVIQRRPDKRISTKPIYIECVYEYRRLQRTIPCTGDKYALENQRCLFDKDSSGHVTACKLLNHLLNCEHFSCPSDYVKCPKSFCVAERFVCDGVKQCPFGEDELDCWCKEQSTEIAVVFSGSTSADHLQHVYKLARQFYTKDSLVRAVNIQGLVVDVDDDINENGNTLDVSERVIDPSNEELNRNIYTEHQVKGEDFIRYLVSTFSRRKRASKRGIVLIQRYDTDIQLMRLLTTNISRTKGVHIYTISIDTSISNSFERSVKWPLIKLKAKQWTEIGSIGSVLFPEICTELNESTCHHRYRCQSSHSCIPLNQLCDGQRHCHFGDDELYCTFRCPHKCTCHGYNIDCKNTNFSQLEFLNMSKITRTLDVSSNSLVFEPNDFVSMDLPLLLKLNLSQCTLIVIERKMFQKVKNLLTLDLSFNLIGRIPSLTFKDLIFLNELVLIGNFKLHTIEPRAFIGLGQIRQLDLRKTNINRIYANTFVGLNLTKLDLSKSQIQHFDDFAFMNLEAKEIDFADARISYFGRHLLTGVRSLQILKTPAFKFCCVKPDYLEAESCLPHRDAFSSCEDLISNTILQALLWIIGLSALLGNALSLLYRLVYDKGRLKLGFGIFVTNLAVADFIMGIYLTTIAIADLSFRSRYILMDDYWRNSAWCTLAGVMSTVSSEASVLFLCLITLDRVFVIKYPFGNIRFKTKSAIYVSVVAWLVASFIAVLPVVLTSYFQNKFYTKSAVCLALPLTSDRPPGWLYSMAIFVGMNFVTFVLIAFGQFQIYIEVRKSSQKLKRSNNARRNDLRVARNLLLVVTTDFMCWFPIGCMGFMAIGGYEISGDVYSWAAVIILPINSALNPVLYTLSAIVANRTFNPSVEEQLRNDASKDIGDHMLNLWNNGHFIRAVDTHDTRSLTDLLRVKRKFTVTQVACVTLQLAKCVNFLHGYELVHGHLNKEDNIKLVHADGKSYRSIKLAIRPAVSTRADDKYTDIYDMGCLVKHLLSNMRPAINPTKEHKSI